METQKIEVRQIPIVNRVRDREVDTKQDVFVRLE